MTDRESETGLRRNDRHLIKWKTCHLVVLSSLVFLACFSCSHGFNLEVRVPIVKFGGAYNDSYFGYSVAQHRTSAGQPVILVGAPRDKNLQPGTNRTGALYRCPLSLDTDDCTQVETDGKRHDRGRLYGIYDGNVSELMPPVSSEIKEDQWLGVSLQSQGAGGKVLVCAHRYTVRDVFKYNRKPVDTKRGILGMCYILDSDLNLPRDTNIGARDVLVIREAMRGKRMELINDFDNHAVYGACQVGTSVSWVQQDDSTDEDYALFGAPGCFTWRGNVLAQKTGTAAKYETAVRPDNNLEYTKHGHLGLSVTSGRYFDGELQFAAGAPHVNGRQGSGEIYFYTRDIATSKLVSDKKLTGGRFGAGFGYSLETLDVNGDGLDDMIVGAPFTDNGGEGGGAVYIYINTNKGLDSSRYLKLEGPTKESQFGLALARLGDLNKDGFEDFAVGAPYDGLGVVYIFLGSATGLVGIKSGRISGSADDVASQVISGQHMMEQRGIPIPQNFKTFGSSLSGGDIDLDGNTYPDLLIGAYGSNAAYLLLSRPIINISTRIDDSLLQAIDPGQAGCTPDPDSAYTCFQFSACFKLNSIILHSKSGMKIKFLIVAEPGKPVSRVWLRIEEELRISIENGESSQPDDKRKNRIEHTLLINAQGEDYCTSMVGYLSNTHTDLQTPVKFALSYTMVQDEPKVMYNAGQPMISVNQYPILNQQQALRTFYAKFEKNCGEDDLCQAQLMVEPSLKTTSGQELKRSQGQGIYQLELGTLPDNQIVLDLNIQNLGEAAYEAKLEIVFPNHISYVGLGNNSDNADLTLVNTTFISINLGNPFRGKVSGEGRSNNISSSLNIQMRFAPASIINETLITFEFLSSTTSELVVDALTFLNCVVVRRAELKITGRSLPADSVFYGGQVRGESALQDLSEIGPMVHHRYLVSNHGPSEVDVVTVKIKWPHQVENFKTQGKWLLYLTEHPYLKNGRGDCTIPSGYPPNPLNLTRKIDQNRSRFARYEGLNPDAYSDISDNPFDMYSDENSLYSSQNLSEYEQLDFATQTKQRVRREIEHIVAAQRVWNPSALAEEEGVEDPGQLVVKLDCDRGTAKCLTITCQVYNLPARDSVTVEIKARLWNSTLVEDYSNVDRVEIYSKASVIIDSVYTQDPSNDHESILTVALPDRQLEPRQPPAWWIYILSAAVGVLLLVIIIMVLSKVGFFQRTRPLEEDEDSEFMVSAHFEKVKLNGNGVDSF